jgi:hypothetical protein
MEVDMSQKKDKNMRKVAKDMTEKLIPQMANNTMEVMTQMKETWPLEEKVQWCRWFLGLEDLENLIPEFDEPNPNQLELSLEPPQDVKDEIAKAEGFEDDYDRNQTVGYPTKEVQHGTDS